MKESENGIANSRIEIKELKTKVKKLEKILYGRQ